MGSTAQPYEIDDDDDSTPSPPPFPPTSQASVGTSQASTPSWGRLPASRAGSVDRHSDTQVHGLAPTRLASPATPQAPATIDLDDDELAPMNTMINRQYALLHLFCRW